MRRWHAAVAAVTALVLAGVCVEDYAVALLQTAAAAADPRGQATPGGGPLRGSGAEGPLEAPPGGGLRALRPCFSACGGLLEDRVVVPIGASPLTKKCVPVGSPVVCDEDFAGSGASFAISVDRGTTVCARRVDAASGWGADLEVTCRLHQGVVVSIGMSSASQKCVAAVGPVSCAVDAGDRGIRVNADLSSSADVFHISVANVTQVCAQRAESSEGWGMNLQIVCSLGQARGSSSSAEAPGGGAAAPAATGGAGPAAAGPSTAHGGPPAPPGGAVPAAAEPGAAEEAAVNEAHRAQQNADLFRHHKQAPGGWARSGGEPLLDLGRCSQDYPAFASYLDRRFGNRSLVGSKAASEGDLRFNFKITSNFSAAVDVANKAIGRPSLLTVEWDSRAGAAELRSSAAWGASPHTFYNVERTLGRHGELIQDELEQLGGEFTMAWRGDLVDPPCARPAGVPLHGTSSEEGRGDIAMPDWTFFKYASIHSGAVHSSWTSDSWPDVSERLGRVRPSRQGLVYSGSWRAGRGELRKIRKDGPPADLAEAIQALMPDGINVTLLRKASHGGEETTRGGWASLYEQCTWPWTFHTPGNHYSAMLKYKMSCGQTVFFHTQLGPEGHPRQEEFWYDALVHGVNVFFFKSPEEFWDLFRELLGVSGGKAPGPADLDRARRTLEQVGQAGKRLVQSYLSERGLDCYIMLYLKRYYLPLLLQQLPRQPQAGQ